MMDNRIRGVMENLESLALKYREGRLLVLDQRQLPFTEHWVHCRSPAHMCEIIRTLQVRGAPLIGIAAALALADYALQGASETGIREAATQLLRARPTAVNLKLALDRLVFASPGFCAGTVVDNAVALFREDVVLCDRIAEQGATLIRDGDNLLTHCNTGSLVTTGVGTALGVIKRAWEQGKHLHVYVDETRPLFQGARLTTWELEQAGIPHTLICDNMAAALMAQGKISKVLVGSDRIALNGDAANKIGTYSLAVLAAHHGIPFYVVAPYTTVDPETPSGDAIPIEQRAPEEVNGYTDSRQGTVNWTSPRTPAINPAFDVTPVELITAIVLDSGIFPHPQLRRGALNERYSRPRQR